MLIDNETCMIDQQVDGHLTKVHLSYNSYNRSTVRPISLHSFRTYSKDCASSMNNSVWRLSYHVLFGRNKTWRFLYSMNKALFDSGANTLRVGHSVNSKF